MLTYMKEQFAIVNQKLDDLKSQINDVENNLIFQDFKTQFGLYKTTLQTCGLKLKSFQLSGTQGTRDAFYDSCCTSADRKPLNYLAWMTNNVGW